MVKYQEIFGSKKIRRGKDIPMMSLMLGFWGFESLGVRQCAKLTESIASATRDFKVIALPMYPCVFTKSSQLYGVIVLSLFTLLLVPVESVT